MNLKIKHLNRRSLLILLLAAGGLALTPQLFSQVYTLGTHLAKDLPHLLSTTEEQRRLEAYGDKNIMGYGYLKKVLEGIPDPYLFPLVKYQYYGMHANVVLPGNRNALDKRILVGIDLLPQDVSETIVSRARRVSEKYLGTSLVTGWGFITQWEYDLLTGALVYFKEPLPAKQSFKAIMLNSPSDHTQIGDWSWQNVPLKNPVKLTFDKPLKEVYGRGSLPFAFVLENRGSETDATAQVTQVEMLGVKAQIHGYTMIHEEGRCFMAIEDSFFNEILEKGPEEWRAYLRKITNLPAISAKLAEPAKEK